MYFLAEANTISQTAMGAILVASTSGLCGVIVALWFYIRSLVRKVEDLAEKRVQDANEHNDASRQLERESMSMVNEATKAIGDLTRKVCDSTERTREGMQDLAKETEEFKKEVSKALNCRECPARSQMRP
jgi:predicted Holliday junction resolvase-like endonuclease